MSELVAKVVSLESHGSLHRVQCDCKGTQLSFMTLELPGKIVPGSEVKLTVKPSQVGIGKEMSGMMSFSNLLDVTIVSIENGVLLSSLMLELHEGCVLESVITKKSVERMNLQEGDRVVAIIKGSEMGIIEVQNV